MKMSVYRDAANEMLQMKPKVVIRTDDTPEEATRRLFNTDPRILYYLSGMSTTMTDHEIQLEPRYCNQGYTPEKVQTASDENLERILRTAVSASLPMLVFTAANSVNVNWALQRFHKSSVWFYPNLVSYSISTIQHRLCLHCVYILRFQYRIGSVMMRKMEIEVEQELQRLQRVLFQEGMDDAVKALIAHNYLAATITYDDDDHNSPLERSYLQSAYGALILKRCVCQGYAEAYKRLMDAAGIACDVVCGNTLLERDGWHAWNIVHLNKGRNCCHVDVTWDSHTGWAESQYLFRGDQFMQKGRSWDRHFYPMCAEESALYQRAVLYCIKNRSRLLAAGIRQAWLG